MALNLALLFFASCLTVNAEDQPIKEMAETRKAYQRAPKAELWVGKKHMQEGSSLLHGTTKNMKEHISGMKNVLQRLKDVEQHVTQSIEQAEKENSNYVNMEEGAEKKIESAIKSFQNTVQSFDKMRSKTAKKANEGSSKVTLGSFQVEDSAKQAKSAAERNAELLKKRMQQSEQIMQETQNKMSKITSAAAGSPPLQLDHEEGVDLPTSAKYSIWVGPGAIPGAFVDNSGKLFYTGVTLGTKTVSYKVGLYYSFPKCVFAYSENTFPILAASKCASLAGCSGFGYLIEGNTFWNEDYEYNTNVGMVVFYTEELSCPAAPDKNAPTGAWSPGVVYEKYYPGAVADTGAVSVAMAMGGGGCFSVLSQVGFFSGIESLESSGALSLLVTSSGGTWTLALMSLLGGGVKGKMWPVTWDSIEMRKKIMGSKPIWTAMFKSYQAGKDVVAESLTETIGCSSESFKECNAKTRTGGELASLVGVGLSCARPPATFKKFLMAYLFSLTTIYGTGAHLNKDGLPDYSPVSGGYLGYNLIGALWAGVVKSWLFAPNGLLTSQSITQIGWSYAGRWINCVTHFTTTFAGDLSSPAAAIAKPVIPVHRYVDPVEMTSIGSVDLLTAGDLVVDPNSPIYHTVVSSVAASSNVPAQTILDLIWLIEGNLCSMTTEDTLFDIVKQDNGWKQILTIAMSSLGPVLMADKQIGEMVSKLQGLAFSGLTNLSTPTEAKALEGFTTPSPLVLQIGYILPSSGIGFEGDSSTTDDGGFITAVLTLDDIDPVFRPKEILTLLATSGPFFIERYFLAYASVYATFLPLSERASDHGLDCSKAKEIMVENPYKVCETSGIDAQFKGPECADADACTWQDHAEYGTLAAHDVTIAANKYFDITGGWSVDLKIYSLATQFSDGEFLGFLPSDWSETLKQEGFPAYMSSRNAVASMFAVDFLKSWTLYATSAYRGFFLTCGIVAFEGAIPGTKECRTMSTLNKLFHDENVVTSLLTPTPAGTANPFEPLRANIKHDMAGFAFWGKDKLVADPTR